MFESDTNNSSAQSTLQHRKRGRPPGSRNLTDVTDKWIAARGIHPATAAEILSQLGERGLWRRLLNSEDDGVCLRALCYLTDKRDGRASQQINITSVGINMTTSEIESARAIVREIMGDRVPLPTVDAQACVVQGDLIQTDGMVVTGDDSGDRAQVVENARLMLPSNEGQELVVPTPNTSGV